MEKQSSLLVSLTIDSRVQGLETDHVHTLALYIEPSAVNFAPFNTSYYHFPERSSSTTGVLIFETASEEEKLVRVLYAV